MEAESPVLSKPSAQLRVALQANAESSYSQVNGRPRTRAHYPKFLPKHGLRRSGGWRDVSSTKRLSILIVISSVNRISICQSMVILNPIFGYCYQLTNLGFEGLRIATSGMGHDILHISKVVRLAGASYDEVLLPKTSILVVPGTATNPEKIAYAAKHKIPVVSDTWLYSSLQHARKMPMNGYMVAGGPKQMLDRQYLDHPSREASIAPPQDKR